MKKWLFPFKSMERLRGSRSAADVQSDDKAL